MAKLLPKEAEADAEKATAEKEETAAAEKQTSEAASSTEAQAQKPAEPHNVEKKPEDS